MLLTVDVGNTSIKWGLFEGETLVENGRCGDGAEMVQAIPAADVDAAAMASVVPDRTGRIRSPLEERLGFPVRVAGEDLPIPIVNLCVPPERVGVDRLLDALAAYHRIGDACIVVDVGSAITVNTVDAQGRFMGGAIAPGPGLQFRALHEFTAQLPRASFARPLNPVGADTMGAIQSGVYWGTVGAVSELIRQALGVVGGRRPVIATGGACEALAADIPAISECDPFLTLRGIRLAHRVLITEESA
jgi:type III pantothenate kinase